MEQKAYKIFIIEDSDKDRELLEKSLASYNLFQVVGCLPGGSGALALIQRLHPDLLFIDVELPGLPGYEIVNKLHDVVMWDMKVVFYYCCPIKSIAYKKSCSAIVYSMAESCFVILSPCQKIDS